MQLVTEQHQQVQRRVYEFFKTLFLNRVLQPLNDRCLNAIVGTVLQMIFFLPFKF
jgi:hypothetical protein